MKKIGATLVLLTLFLLSVDPASANTITYSGSYSGPTDVTNKLIPVQKFNPSLGTLLSATFALDAAMTTQAFATNDGDFYAGWDKLTYQFSLAGSGSYSDVSINASNAPIRIVGSGDPDGSFTIGEALRITGQPLWSQSGPNLSQAATFSKSTLADFIGIGEMSFFLTTLNQDTIYVAGNQTNGLPSPAPFGVSTSVLANVNVTYDFTPVPIPGAVWLMGSGLVGLVGLRRRFQN